MTLAPITETSDLQVPDILEQLEASENLVELLQESVADLELAAEDRGWRRLGFALEHEFSRDGLNQIAANCRVMAIASPLVKRGLQLRIGYIWGQGVQLAARDEQVNDLLQAFWDDPSTQTALSSQQACEENERALGTDGNFLLALFTDPLTGRVQPRSTPFEEIVDKITNPEDRDETWYFVRQYTTTLVRPFVRATGATETRTRDAVVKVLHPAVGYWPATRPRTIDGHRVAWEAPMLHVAVNRLDGWKWGIPDVYASLPWARAYDGFLTDWARLVKALSKFAWQLTGDKSARARKATDVLRARTPRATANTIDGRDSTVGQVAAAGPGVKLEAIPKSGATIDSESGKPLAAMVAAGLGVPVTMLLADPGTTGARAVAETLDKPTILEMGMRRELWKSVIATVTSYVVDQAIRAPRGPLSGRVSRDPRTGQQIVELAGDQERTVDVDFPPLDDLDPASLIEAIERADTVGGPGIRPTLVRLILQALRVKDIDELMDALTDDDGNWIDPEMTAGQVAARAFERGADSARPPVASDDDPDGDDPDA